MENFKLLEIGEENWRLKIYFINLLFISNKQLLYLLC